MITSNFCQRLTSALAARQLSRNQLVHLGGQGFTYRKIQAYCAGTSAPSLPFLILLGRLGFDLHYLITGTATPLANLNTAQALLAQLATILQDAQATLAALTPVLAQPHAPNPAPTHAHQLSANEAAILAALRAAPPAQQELILAMVTVAKAPAGKAGAR
jgi:hypothetical protein